MNTIPAKMWVFVSEQFACIKISGRANFSSSVDFKNVIEELRLKGCTCLVLDLSECTLMDSTFLGVMAGFGLKTNKAKNENGPAAIQLLNPNERVTELLESLGLLPFFKIAQGPIQVPDTTQSQALPGASPSKEEMTRTCLEAHQALIQMDPQNAAKFKEVAAYLAEDVKKAKPGS